MIPPIVDSVWLREHLGKVIVADARWYLDGRPGRAEYERGHLPGARFVDLERWLSGSEQDGGGRHPLPTPQHFAEGMAALGVSDDDTVVAYDDAGGVIAARLVWMLRVTGRAAALLDGGIGGFDGELETAEPAWQPGTFSARPWPEDRLASIDDAADPANLVLDARPAERFRGEPNPADPKPGHIPGARSLPTREHLAADGRFLPVDDLRARFDAAGIDDAGRVVSYCGSGITACHALLTLEHAGLGQGRLYAGSWSEYGATDRPAELGA
jgi:thiosulfate/3-mercaptopyruvate sulfurtransferase